MKKRVLSPNRYKPSPELLCDDQDPWDIRNANDLRGLSTNGLIDKQHRMIIVPFDETGYMVVRHEFGHLLWSPTVMLKTDVPIAFVQAIEDARVNRGLECIDLPMELCDEEMAQVIELGADDLDHGPVGLTCFALRASASYGTNALEPLFELIDDGPPPLFPIRDILAGSKPHRVRELVKQLHEKLERNREANGGPVADAALVPELARWLHAELKALGLPDPPHRPGLVCCAGLPSGKKIAGEHADEIEGLLLGGDADGSGPQPGKLEIVEPPLPGATAPPRKAMARARRSATEGVIMRDVARFLTDQRVFAVKSRRGGGGGAVLIDTSGSMSLSAEDIDALIAGAPEATLVAIYSGREAEGELRVVVREGRRVDVGGLKPFGPSNVVDLPALEWLALQPGPRVWISDGRVTGQHDIPSPSLTARCREICRRARIVRVEDASEAAKILAGRRGYRRAS